MMDGRFSHDLTGAMALVPGAVPAEPFIRRPGLVARAADGLFAPRGPQDWATRLAPVAADGVAAPGLTADPVADPAVDPVADPAPRTQAVIPVAAPTPAPPERAALADARAQARREVMAELDADRAAMAQTARSLAAALERIAHPPASDMDSLTAHLGQAVARLAAQRAGQAIDADAAPFARRVRDLAMRLTESFAQVTLRLHPEDAEALAGLLQADCPPDLAGVTLARLVPDPALNRGDVALHAPGLRLEDRIIPHPAALEDGDGDDR